MGHIRPLSDDLVALISAGEVIENPASIVKELIENSLDAGASLIEIEIEEGGIKSIAVSDNGTGILKEDVPVCIQRHTTSKIASHEDIHRVKTYGFRGEALASIASVAELTIKTRHVDEEIGTQLVSRPNEPPIITDISKPSGTRVEVRNLFLQVPARRKHLQEPKFEGIRIHEIILRHAIIRTDVGFRFVKDGALLIDCPPDQDARDRVLILWGMSLAKNLIPVIYKEKGLIIRGFIVKPPFSRGNRSREYFSVLKRPIEEIRLSKAVERAYSTLLMKGRFPICSLDIVLDVERVDPNVHPTKREVRIQDIDGIVQAVFRAVRKALSPKTDKYETEPIMEETSADIVVDRDRVRVSTTSEEEQTSLLEHMTLFSDSDFEISSKTVDLHDLGGEFRVIGQFQNLYLLLEFNDALVIVDQHAAHERVLYERLRALVNSGEVTIQELIEPYVIKLGPQDVERILNISGSLKALGFEITSFGGNEILVSAVPEILGRIATEQEIISFMDRVLDIGSGLAHREFMDEVIKLTACHSAIRAGQPMSNAEIADLLIDLSKAENKTACCHGRPSIIFVPRKTLDKRFGRTDPEAIARYKARHRTDPQ